MVAGGNRAGHPVVIDGRLEFDFNSFTTSGLTYHMTLSLGRRQCTCLGFQTYFHCKHLRAADTWLQDGLIQFATGGDPFIRFERSRPDLR